MSDNPATPETPQPAFTPPPPAASTPQPPAQPNPYAQAQPYGPYAPGPPKTLSIISMIAGIAGLTLLPLIGTITALITGYMAKSREPAGRGFWLTGIITGWVGVGLAVIGLIFTILWVIFVFSVAGASGTFENLP